MAIHKVTAYGLIFVLLIGNLFMLSRLTSGQPQSNDVSQVLIDKVFTFSAPQDSQEFNDLAFIEENTYYLTVEIVTPHNCTINITLTDPNAHIYRIFETEVNISHDDGWFEIPFGAAFSGNYSIVVDVITLLTLNIHIELIREHKCLYDIIPPNLLNTLKFYEVSWFMNTTKLTHNVQLRSDYSYKFYIARVSSIGGLEKEREVALYYNLKDPENIVFQIYYNESLVPIGNVLSFDFGTAISGVYTFDLLIECNVESVNIAYVIAEDYKLSDEINGTTPPSDPTNNTSPKGIVILPAEFMIGMVVVCGLLVVIVFWKVVRKQKKNSVKQVK